VAQLTVGSSSLIHSSDLDESVHSGPASCPARFRPGNHCRAGGSRPGSLQYSTTFPLQFPSSLQSASVCQLGYRQRVGLTSVLQVAGRRGTSKSLKDRRTPAYRDRANCLAASGLEFRGLHWLSRSGGSPRPRT